MDVKQYTCFRFTESKQNYRPTPWLIRIYLFQTQVLSCRSGQMEKESCTCMSMCLFFLFFLFNFSYTERGQTEKPVLPPPRPFFKIIITLNHLLF